MDRQARPDAGAIAAFSALLVTRVCLVCLVCLVCAFPVAAVAQPATNDLALDVGGATLDLRRVPKGMFTDAPYGTAPALDPEQHTIAGGDERRVLRGGSWAREPKRGRSAARFRSTPGTRYADFGFHVAAGDQDLLVPGLGGATGFATSSPVGIGSGVPSSTRLALGADASPSAPDRAQRSGVESSSPWVLVAAPAAAAGAVLAWMFARRRKSGDVPSEATTRAGEDGFWIRAPGAERGSIVQYTCIVGGVDVENVVPFDGGDETFVYTGGVPSAIRLLETLPPPPDGARRPVSRPDVGPVVVPIAGRRPAPPKHAAPIIEEIVDDEPAKLRGEPVSSLEVIIASGETVKLPIAEPASGVVGATLKLPTADSSAAAESPFAGGTVEIPKVDGGTVEIPKVDLGTPPPSPASSKPAATPAPAPSKPVVPPAPVSSKPVIAAAAPSSKPVIATAAPSSKPVIPPAPPSSKPVIPPAPPSSKPAPAPAAGKPATPPPASKPPPPPPASKPPPPPSSTAASSSRIPAAPASPRMSSAPPSSRAPRPLMVAVKKDDEEVEPFLGTPRAY